MKYRILSDTEKRVFNADVVATLDYTDVAGLGANTTGAALSVVPATTSGAIPAAGTSGTDTVPIGTMVSLVAVVLETNFVSATAAGLTVKVGDGGDDDRYKTAVQLQSGQTPISHIVGTIATNSYAYLAADTVDAIFVSTTANLNTFTAGKVHLYFAVADLNQLPKP